MCVVIAPTFQLRVRLCLEHCGHLLVDIVSPALLWYMAAAALHHLASHPEDE